MYKVFLENLYLNIVFMMYNYMKSNAHKMYPRGS